LACAFFGVAGGKKNKNKKTGIGAGLEFEEKLRKRAMESKFKF